MTEFLMIILLGYITISMGLGVLEYFMDRQKNRKKEWYLLGTLEKLEQGT